MNKIEKGVTLIVTLMALEACVPASDAIHQGDTHLVFFDEFSANLTPDGRLIIDQAAIEAKQLKTHALVVVARANATGSPDATMKLAETRAAVVRDALVADGLPLTMIRLFPIGQAGTTDPGVEPRRVDIVPEG